MLNASPYKTGLVVAALLIGCANAQNVSYSTDIVFDAGGRPSAYATVNDQHEYLFAIDTAAQRTALSSRIVDELNLTADPENRARVHGAAGARYLDMYRLSSLELAGRRIEDGLFIGAAVAHDDDDLGHDGILGQDFFAGQQLVFDFEAETVAFGDLSIRDLGERLPLELMYGGFAIVTIEVGGVSTRAVIDTGASESFANPVLMRALDLDPSQLTQAEITAGVTQQSSIRIEGYTGDIVIGDVVIPSVAFEFTDGSIFNTFQMGDAPGIILGMDALGRLPGFAIDYSASEFRHLLP